MGLPAARVGDPAGHGGVIMPPGSPTVFIGGMPAARMGDMIACPGFTGPVPHVIGNIGPVTSMTVKIAGGFAARQTDPTGCGTAGVSAIGAPPVIGPPASGTQGSFDGGQASLIGNENEGFLWGKYSGYANSDGVGLNTNFSLGHAQSSDGTFSVDLGRVTNEMTLGMGGGSINGQISGLTFQVPVAGSDSMSASYGNASYMADYLSGTDGRRTGLALGLGGQLSISEGQYDHRESEITIGTIPFTDIQVEMRSTATGGYSDGSFGFAARGGLYHDANDNAFHIMGLLDIEILKGFKLGFDIALSRTPTPPSMGTPGISIPITPGTIIKGCPTVLIG